MNFTYAETWMDDLYTLVDGKKCIKLKQLNI